MIRVTGDRVLVALPPKVHVQEASTGYTYQEGHTTGSGITLAKPADVYNIELATRGIVVAVGEKRGTVDLDDARTAIKEAFIGFVGDESTALMAEFDGIEIRDIGRAVDRLLTRLQPAPFDVQPGDCVLFSAAAGDQITDDGHDFVILHESEIIGVVDPTEAT